VREKPPIHGEDPVPRPRHMPTFQNRQNVSPAFLLPPAEIFFRHIGDKMHITTTATSAALHILDSVTALFPPILAT